MCIFKVSLGGRLQNFILFISFYVIVRERVMIGRLENDTAKIILKHLI